MEQCERSEALRAMDAGQVELRAFVRDHRVHFDVRPEVVIRSGERHKVGFEVRLWAVHPKGARVLPGCDKCRSLAQDLERLAAAVLPPEGRPTRHEIEPASPALYDSEIVPGADEICLTVRLFHREEYDRPIDACEERCLKETRDALRVLGVREM